MAALAEILAGLDPETAGAVASSNAMQPAVDAHFQGLAQQLADWGQQQDAMKQRLAGQPLSQQVLDPEALQSAMSIALSTGPGAMETPAQKIMRLNDLTARNDMDLVKQGADNFFQNHTSGQIIPAYDAQGNPLPTGQPQGIRAYHGSPFDFDAFDASKIGTGEGAQAYGHGLYFAEHEPVAQSYRDALAEPLPQFYEGSRLLSGPEENAARTLLQHNSDVQGAHNFLESVRRMRSADQDYIGQSQIALRTLNPAELRREVPPPSGHMYEVNINADPDQFLNWDAPFGQQPTSAKDALHRLAGSPELRGIEGNTGADYYWSIGRKLGNQELLKTGPRSPTLPSVGPPLASQELLKQGIPGIRYLDQGSRGAGDGTSNYVVFNPKIIDIVRKYGLAGLMASGAVASGLPDQK